LNKSKLLFRKEVSMEIVKILKSLRLEENFDYEINDNSICLYTCSKIYNILLTKINDDYIIRIEQKIKDKRNTEFIYNKKVDIVKLTNLIKYVTKEDDDIILNNYITTELSNYNLHLIVYSLWID